MEHIDNIEAMQNLSHTDPLMAIKPSPEVREKNSPREELTSIESILKSLDEGHMVRVIDKVTQKVRVLVKKDGVLRELSVAGSSTSKYAPHQGKREAKRRAKRLARST